MCQKFAQSLNENKAVNAGVNFQLFIDLIPSHTDSPNFWHVISQLRAVPHRIRMVSDRQGSAAHEIPNHWISPSLRYTYRTYFWWRKIFLFIILYITEKRFFSNFAFRILEQWTHEIPKIALEKFFKTQQAS